VSGRGDLKRHVGADEFQAVVGADAAALPLRAEGAPAGGARLRRVLDFRAHHYRLTTPASFRAGLLAGGIAGCLPVLFLSALPAFPAAVPEGSASTSAAFGLLRFALDAGRVVTRRWTRTGRKILARTVGQRFRHLAPSPRQLLPFLTRHRREVCPLDIVQLRGESTRRIKRRILFAPIRKLPSSRSKRHRFTFTRPEGVNGYRARRLCAPPGDAFAPPSIVQGR
jgi:hypothetical protein